MPAPSSRVRRVLRFALLPVAVGLVGVELFFSLGTRGVFALGSVPSGLSYLPPSWLFVAVAIVSVGLFIARARQAALTLLLSFLLLVAPQADFSLSAAPKTPEGPRQSLGVVALNVRYYASGLHTVIQALKDTGADVALLSENVLDPSEAERARQDFLPYTFKMGRSGETAIASRYPILDFRQVDLPSKQASLWGQNELEEQTAHPRRSFVHAVVDVQGTPVHLISLRYIAGRAPRSGLWSQLQWGLYLLRTQAEETTFVLDYLSRLQGPVIVGGDLNAPPTASVIRALDRTLADAYLAHHTFGKPTFRVNVPYLRLDYLFSNAEAPAVAARRLDDRVSDHFPVYAQFSVPHRR